MYKPNQGKIEFLPEKTTRIRHYKAKVAKQSIMKNQVMYKKQEQGKET